ncbi:bifunctional pyr operon transcriptional regulator/uracil phosphoribosyltransferase PyrR [Rhodoluna lacicola]|uniref:bifunctional pyr operon transcriptional regulator/uracil phosphoribosyltransferase PyrR n=1 Tax=Rhodoluna lacicola TaxID=529884 RepID=UPI003084470D
MGVSARTVLSSEDIDRAVTRIAHEILEANTAVQKSSAQKNGTKDLIILGIPTRGVLLAERIAAVIAKAEPNADISNILGRLDITMYRDDLAANPTRAVTETQIPKQGIDDKVVVLVDDVLFSGRTIRAALDALGEYGRPRAVKLAVLVDRGHRELPIRADFVGKNLPTAREERINVNLSETDSQNAVVIES